MNAPRLEVGNGQLVLIELSFEPVKKALFEAGVALAAAGNTAKVAQADPAKAEDHLNAALDEVCRGKHQELAEQQTFGRDRNAFESFLLNELQADVDVLNVVDLELGLLVDLLSDLICLRFSS